MRQAFIGVDVGTSSARAGVFDEKGTLLATARHSITVWHEAGSVVEQSSSEIWAACAASVRAAIAEARLVNDTHDDLLRYVGGSISPEMEIPKLLWLKRHLPSSYRSAGHFF